MRLQLFTRIEKTLVEKVRGDKPLAGTNDIVLEAALKEWFRLPLGKRRRAYRFHDRLPYQRG